MATKPTGQVLHYLKRPGGRVGYDLVGGGPLIVLVPGMGDLRTTYRFVAPRLCEAGYKVACTELRGHGDSSTGFDSYGDEDTAADIVALIEALRRPGRCRWQLDGSGFGRAGRNRSSGN